MHSGLTGIRFGWQFDLLFLCIIFFIAFLSVCIEKANMADRALQSTYVSIILRLIVLRRTANLLFKAFFRIYRNFPTLLPIESFQRIINCHNYRIGQLNPPISSRGCISDRNHSPSTQKRLMTAAITGTTVAD